MGEASSVYTAVGSLALVLIPICVYTARQLWSLLPLLENSNEIRLEFDNGQLQGTRFWILFLSLIIKSVLRRTGLISLPRFVEGPNGRYTLQGYSDISLNMPFKFTKEDISLYTLSVGKSVHLDENLLHLQLFLSAMTEPAMLILLSKRGCPIDPIGSVNVRNSFQLLDRPAAVSLINNHGSVKGYRIKSTLPMETKKVKRGWENRFVVDLINDESRPIFRQTFTMLQFARHGTFPDLLIESEKEIRTDTIGRIEIPPESPATWAKLCKDYNPIHLSSIAARALGFKSTIAHGNHVVARALALSPRSDKEVGWMEVEFKRPVLLPATLDVASSEESGRMEIGQKEKVHVLVRYGDSSCSEP